MALFEELKDNNNRFVGPDTKERIDRRARARMHGQRIFLSQVKLMWNDAISVQSVNN